MRGREYEGGVEERCRLKGRGGATLGTGERCREGTGSCEGLRKGTEKSLGIKEVLDGS